MDSLDRIIFESAYDILTPLTKEVIPRYYRATLEQKEGVIDITGRIVVPLIYDKIESYADSTFFKATKGKTTLLINRQGKIVFPGMEFATIDHFIELPAQQYLFYFSDHCSIVNANGDLLKVIQSVDVKKLVIDQKEMPFLEIKEGDQIYLMNEGTLVEYRHR